MAELEAQCPNCHLDEIDWSIGTVIPVWENIDDFQRGEDPDWAGCTICHTMRPVSKGDEV